VDRSVSGLIAQQQCCGPLQLPLADVAVVAQSYFGLTGAATAIGEQARKMLINPRAGARMAVGEALTNICWAGISSCKDIRFSANWMWAPKLPGEGAALYDAATGLCEALMETGTAIDGGKDSLSMATKVGDETVKSPRQLVMSAYAPVPDITKVVTPDIKRPGESILVFVDLATGKNRLGGSALAHCHKQIGNECPDMDFPELTKNACDAMIELVKKDLLLAGHDRSDGGLAVALAEMAFGGNCGLNVDLADSCTALEKLYSEELGLVFECLPENLDDIRVILDDYSAGFVSSVIGQTMRGNRITINYNHEIVLSASMPVLRDFWHETCYHLELEQCNENCIASERDAMILRKGTKYELSFVPTPVAVSTKNIRSGIPVAILREEGCNGEMEMAGAVSAAGLEPWDVTITDLLEGKITLDRFRMIIPVGGFTYADDPEAAKGWAITLMYNEMLKKQFEAFRNRKDTLSLGICNGNQLLTLLGWISNPETKPEDRPYLARNISGRFESRFTALKINHTPAVMLQGMEGSILPIWSAHGEGRYYFPNEKVLNNILASDLVPVSYVDDNGNWTEKYPFNPNGSPFGIAGLCSPDGRHLTIMPHPERTFRLWQWAYLPEKWKHLKESPWLQMFVNARLWLEKPVRTDW
jgi:phosphoribosylformylglycinamidine synthase